ncbi:MAG: nucleotidyltransferase family protein [Prevotella sp.]|nr:nucleotidyltransferase family protein [Prevotella sp.]
MKSEFESYLKFLRFCLSETGEVPDCARDISWMNLRDFANQHSIVGVCWRGVERLGSMTVNKPTDDDVMAWMALVAKVRKQNRLLDEKTLFVSQAFLTEGFPNCILKGQGNALMYPDPTLRMAGDVDIWLDGTRRDITRYVRGLFPKSKMIYLHIDFPAVKGVDVEVHYRPSYVNNPFCNRRLQRWFESEKREQMGRRVALASAEGSVPVPTIRFNLVYQLCHVMHHIFDEGIGLRQLVDYYYLLLQAEDIDRAGLNRQLSSYNMLRFARAMMWIEHEILGLPERYLLADPDEKRGRVVLEDVLRGGTFGRYNDDYEHASARRFYPKRAYKKLVHSLKFMRYFPSEAFFEPLFRTWHFLWRMRYRA